MASRAQLSLTNWQCHRNLELDFAFPLEVFFADNMRGKSAIRDAIEFAIAGTGTLRGIATKKDLAKLSIHDDASECSVSLRLPEIAIERSMKRSGVQELVFAESGSETSRIAGGKLTETQARLWAALGITERQLRAVLDAHSLFVLAPNERRELVASVLGEVAIDEEELVSNFARRGISNKDASDVAKSILGSGWRATEQGAARRRADAKLMIEALGSPPAPDPIFKRPGGREPIDLRTMRREDVENRIETLRETQLKTQVGRAESRGAIEARLSKAEEEYREKVAEIESLGAAGVDVGAAEKLASEARVAEIEARAKLVEMNDAIENLVGEVETMEGTFVAPKHCPAIPGEPLCPMTPAKLRKHEETLAKRAKETRTKLDNLARALPPIEADVARLDEEKRSAVANLEAEKDKRAMLAAATATLSALESDVERDSKALADAKEEVESEGSFIAERISQGEAMLEAKRRFDEETERAETYEQTLADHVRDRDRWDLIATSLKPDAVEADFLVRFLDPLKQAIENFGERFGGMRVDGEFNVEWRYDGQWRRWQQLSESGRLRVGYAVQYAFAKLSGFPFLVLDQVDHLDPKGRRILVDVLRDLAPKFAVVRALATRNRAGKVISAPFDDVGTLLLDDDGGVRRVS
jgi:DNA repair exonuclease SbcCD ATPase subunit